jgi:hypothetical protein
MADLRLVTYCGLYCDLCAQRARVPDQAATLRGTLSNEGVEYWGPSIPGFRPFWDFLSRLCTRDNACPGCRQGGGPPECRIRACARERGIEVCPNCEDYPCELVTRLGAAYPTMVADGTRLKRIGVEAWIAEQDERAKTGFAYCDIRYAADDLPYD